ncbi:MAG: Loki-CTERM sorting domain-containing protein [Gemmatimonadales bacterium]|nr:Loki-CTERM sorting domain-containing protein [Gemmatimonadales bacterium]
MLHTVYRSENPAFAWLDVVAPTEAELRELAAKYELYPTAVHDCLDPEHLPKYERIGDTTFLILRVHDPKATDMASTVQELTRKIAIFKRHDLMLTIHRAELPQLQELRQRFATNGRGEECNGLVLVAALVNGALDSYEKPLQHAEDSLDALEEGLFSPTKKTPSLRRIHVLKRRVSLIKRMLWQTQSVIQRLVPSGDRSLPILQDLRENAESYHFWADQLHEEVTNLLGIHVALAEHKTNEVMRVLTIFSAFFLPLTFIVGVYGMNFDVMPELRSRWGYPVVLLLMAAVCAVIFLWFRRRGWLGRSDP